MSKKKINIVETSLDTGHSAKLWIEQGHLMFQTSSIENGKGLCHIDNVEKAIKEYRKLKILG